MTPAKFRWGMILIQIGVLILMQNHGIITDLAWESLIVLFPVVLIAIGIEKIFTKTKLQFIAYLTTLALFLGGFAIALTASNMGDGPGGYFTDSIYRKDLDTDVSMIKATMILDENDLTIRDSGPDLILAEFDEYTRKPDIESIIEDNTAHIDFEAVENSFFGGAVKINNGEKQHWTVRFAENLPLELECFGFDNDLHLNFLTSYLQKLTLDTDNSSIYLKIGDNEPIVQVAIGGDESKLRLRIPEKSGVKIFSDDASYFQRLGFDKSDDGSFINSNYKTAEHIIELDIDEKLTSISLDYY